MNNNITSTIVIEARNVLVKFSSQVVFNDVNIKIHENESFVILGPSGEGKTVLLKTLAGLIEPNTGDVLIYGKKWKEMAKKEKKEILKKMGMLFQKNALFDSLTCFENIAFPLREVSGSRVMSESEIKEKVEFFLNAVGIAHARDLFPDEISGGMQKRLGIARALALDPKIIFYDDPTAGLDPITSRKIIELILDLKAKNNSTVIAITNDINRAYQMADRLAFVNNNQVLITGDVSSTRNHSNLEVRQFVSGSLSGPLTDLE